LPIADRRLPIVIDPVRARYWRFTLNDPSCQSAFWQLEIGN